MLNRRHHPRLMINPPAWAPRKAKHEHPIA